MSTELLRKPDRVADDLLRRIVSGELEVGSLLPREEALAAEYGVNRGVVREAIKLLEVHRLVEPRRRRGTEVLDPLQSLTPEVIRAMLVPAPGVIDPLVLADLLELRASLDEEMTALAARRRTDEDLAALEACRAELAASLADRARYSRALDALGLAMARAAHNRLYLMLAHWHRRVLVDLGPLMEAVRAPGEPHLQGVALLLDLVRRGAADEARELVRAFHRWATPRLLAAARGDDAPEETS